MISFEFMYNTSWYKYTDGWIYKQCGTGYYHYCPVLKELQDRMEFIPEEVRPIVMQGLLHTFSYGINAGEKKKIQEFKSVFALD